MDFAPPAAKSSLARPRLVRVLLIGLLVADTALVALHLWQDELGLTERFRLDRDGGYPERWGYAKVLGAASCLALLAVRWRSGVLACWTLVLGIVVVDDAVQLHERGGRHLAWRLGIEGSLGLRAVDYGELLVWAVLGLTLAAPVYVFHRKAGHRSRNVSSRLGLLVLTLAAFAVGADMAHQLLPSAVEDLAVLVEDGGELVVQTLILVYTATLLRLELEGSYRRASPVA